MTTCDAAPVSGAYVKVARPFGSRSRVSWKRIRRLFVRLRQVPRREATNVMSVDMERALRARNEILLQQASRVHFGA